MKETDLIQGCLKKDSNAQRALFEKYAGILMTICRRYAKDQPEAEDMLQDAFISIFSHINQFKSLEGVNFEKKIKEKLSLFVEPYYRYQLNSMTISSVQNVKFIDIAGISFGARYYFKK